MLPTIAGWASTSARGQAGAARGRHARGDLAPRPPDPQVLGGGRRRSSLSPWSHAPTRDGQAPTAACTHAGLLLEDTGCTGKFKAGAGAPRDEARAGAPRMESPWPSRRPADDLRVAAALPLPTTSTNDLRGFLAKPIGWSSASRSTLKSRPRPDRARGLLDPAAAHGVRSATPPAFYSSRSLPVFHFDGCDATEKTRSPDDSSCGRDGGLRTGWRSRGSRSRVEAANSPEIVDLNLPFEVSPQPHAGLDPQLTRARAQGHDAIWGMGRRCSPRASSSSRGRPRADPGRCSGKALNNMTRSATSSSPRPGRRPRPSGPPHRYGSRWRRRDARVTEGFERRCPRENHTSADVKRPSTRSGKTGARPVRPCRPPLRSSLALPPCPCA